MDVVVWLRSLGLGQYEAVFRENEIDETVLPRLTQENLKELGVTALGHRLQAARCHCCAACRCKCEPNDHPRDLRRLTRPLGTPPSAAKSR